VSHFELYVKHNEEDKRINLNDVWSWAGFAKKDHAYKTLQKYPPAARLRQAKPLHTQ
jgi:hypothetical protein